MGQLALLFLIVFAIHLAPAFTPPTWPVIALYAVNTSLPMPLLVVIAALAAALGRSCARTGIEYLRASLSGAAAQEPRRGRGAG